MEMETGLDLTPPDVDTRILTHSFWPDSLPWQAAYRSITVMDGPLSNDRAGVQTPTGH